VAPASAERARLGLALALAAGLALPAGALGWSWPMPGHDAARTSRAEAVAAQRPALLPGWPLTGAGDRAPLVAPGGAVRLGLPDGRAGIVNADGTWRRIAPAPRAVAIGRDGRLYSFFDGGRRVTAHDASGRLLWRSAAIDLGPEASDREIRPAPDGSVYVAGAEGVAALDATGALRWEARGGMGNRPGALAVAPDGTVVFGLVGAGPAPLLVARGADGAERWRAELTGSALKVAVAADGTVVVALDRASAQGGAALVAVAPGGAERWRVDTGPIPPSGLALGTDGTAYAVVARGLLRAGGTLVDGTLMAVAPDGAVRWRVEGPLAAADPIVGGDGTVYAGGSPLRAVRPDGRAAWTWPTSRPLIPRAIGAEGTLYLAAGILERAYAAPAGTVLALAAPGARNAITLPDARRQRPLIAALNVRPATFRTAGPVALCATRARCRPSTPLGATLSFALRREATVSLLVRRVADGRLVARLDRRVLPGTTWRSALDLRTAAAPLPPGRYALTARAAAGGARAVAGPVRFTVAPRAAP
jgi:outer membrane protein assembly factor BamB